MPGARNSLGLGPAPGHGSGRQPALLAVQPGQGRQVQGAHFAGLGLPHLLQQRSRQGQGRLDRLGRLQEGHHALFRLVQGEVHGCVVMTHHETAEGIQQRRLEQAQVEDPQVLRRRVACLLAESQDFSHDFHHRQGEDMGPQLEGVGQFRAGPIRVTPLPRHSSTGRQRVT